MSSRSILWIHLTMCLVPGASKRKGNSFKNTDYNMPIKIGKSKSSSGSELMHTNSCPDENSNQTKKTRGLKQFFNRSKGNSKIPTGRSSATEESLNSTKTTRAISKALDGINVLHTESSPINMLSITCHSVSPKLYTNSCASSTEELSNSTCTNFPVTSSAIPCSPIQDVILEEDYEEALLLNNRTEPLTKTDSDQIAKDKSTQPTNITMKISQGIYNEPNDSAQGSNKEIIETCRICQITPTNQFKEIRSRSGSDTDPVLVHQDVIVGSRCSTNSSSIGSAVTLSDSPVVVSSSYSPHTPADNQSSPNIPSVPNTITPSITALSINIQASIQSSSGPPTVYTNSPKGNTIICHHPSSPFAPPSASKPNSSSNPSTAIPTVTNSSPSTSPIFYDNQEHNKTSSTTNIISRRPAGFGKPAPGDSNHSSGKQSTDGIASSSDNVQSNRNSERRSEHYSKQPVYEEAWDLKLQRMYQDMANQSGKERPRDNVSTISSVLPNHSINAIQYTRPQSAAGAQRRTHSPGSKYSSPPAVPPHRRSSVHIKKAQCNSFEDPKTFSEHNQASQPTSECHKTNIINDDSLDKKSSLKSHLKHNINPSFDDHGITTDYDYAYNETWSLGVQRNMTLNLSNNSTEISNAQRNDSAVLANGYMDKIDSVDSEESSSLSTSQETPSQEKESCVRDQIVAVNPDEEIANVDNDSLSNDSYEEPWDVRHGRVISELTSTRLIDPACVLSAHEQLPATRTSTTGSHNNHHRSHCTQDQSTHNTSGLLSSSRQRSMSGSRHTSTNTVISSSSLINKSITLDEQPWYHETCSRSQAEQLLIGAVEGSFLVRKSETCRNDYSLTIRHNNDYLHMKISRNSNGFILGQYSQPYVTIPHMLHHYSLTMVPVRGADAVILKNPIIR